MREVADELGNTPAVARGSYVDPRVVQQFEAERSIRPALRRLGRGLQDASERDALERAVVVRQRHAQAAEVSHLIAAAK